MNGSDCCYECMNNNDILIWIRYQDGKTPLHYACEAGSIEIVECLMKDGVQTDIQTYVMQPFYIIYFCIILNAVYQMGYLPIHCAASGGNLTLVKYFIELGVDVNAKTKVSIANLD